MPEPTRTATLTGPLRTHSFRAMACQVTIQLEGVGVEEATEAFGKVEEIFREVESSCTRFNPDSPLMTANGSPRRWHQVPRSCFSVLREAHQAYLTTEGLFDPRVLRSLEAHGYDRSLPFGEGSVQVSGCSPASIDPAQWQWRPRFRAESNAVRLGPQPVDLGGIGKGLAVRWALDAIRGHGSSALVEAGGDIAARGAGPEGTGWRVAVEDPSVPAGAKHRQPIAVLEVSDRAVATSSIRLRRWQVDGRDAHHLIDPRTGRPATTGLASVTVIHEDPALAEVWSKSLFISGAGTIEAQAREKGLAALWVNRAGQIQVSPEGREYVLWEEQDEVF